MDDLEKHPTLSQIITTQIKSDRFRQLVDGYAQQFDAWMFALPNAKNKKPC
jgi:hypothetical protein